MMTYDVFISYASTDIAIAERLYDDLDKAQVNLWAGKNELSPGRNWQLEIKKAIEVSTFFLPIISPKSLKVDGFTQDELASALSMLDKEYKADLYVIPVRFDECRINPQLQQYYWVDFFPSYADGLNKLLDVIKPDLVHKSRMWKK